MPRKRAFGVRLIETPQDSKLAARAAGMAAIDELEAALREDRPVSYRRSRTLLFALAAWRAKCGTLSLDAALGLVAPSLPHGLAHEVLGKRDHVYLVELAKLLAIGFKAKEADIAVTERFAASPPWGADHPILKKPLKLSTVTDLRKQWIGLAANIGDGKTVKLYGRYFAEASTWSREERAAYLAQYPAKYLPARFK